MKQSTLLVSILVLFMLWACSPESQDSASHANRFTRHQTGPVSIELPTTWKPVDYELEHDSSIQWGRNYVFVDPDTIALKFQTLLFVSSDKYIRSKGYWSKFKAALVPGLKRTGMNYVRVIEMTDTIIDKRQILLADMHCRAPDVKQDLATTMAFYERDSLLVTVVGISQFLPERVRLQNRKLVHQVVRSVQ